MGHDDAIVESGTTCIHISDDAWQVGKNQPASAAVIGDPGLVMEQLAERVRDRLDEETRQQRIQAVETMKDSLASTVRSMGEDETPEGETRSSKAGLVDRLREVAPDAYIVDEGITAKYPLLTRWEMGPEQLISNKGGGLGYGLPASLGAALAESMRPEPRDVVGYVGDGSYLYYPHSIYTAARHDLDLTVVIPDNRNYRILKDNTISIFGGSDEDHDYVGMDFEPPVDLVKNAESHGAEAQLVETPGEIGPAFEAALDSNGTTVLDVLVHD